MNFHRCGHIIGSECIAQWLNPFRSEIVTTCPFCRAAIVRTHASPARAPYANEDQWAKKALGPASQVLWCFRMKTQELDMHPIMEGGPNVHLWSFASLSAQSECDLGQVLLHGLLIEIVLITTLTSGSVI